MVLLHGADDVLQFDGEFGQIPADGLPQDVQIDIEIGVYEARPLHNSDSDNNQLLPLSC
jgi:hypothetical protein